MSHMYDVLLESITFDLALTAVLSAPGETGEESWDDAMDQIPQSLAGDPAMQTALLRAVDRALKELELYDP